MHVVPPPHPPGGGNCVPFSVCSHGSQYAGGITGSKGKAAWNGPSQPCLSVPELNRNFLSQQQLCLKPLITSLNLFRDVRSSPCASGESRRTKALCLGSLREESGTACPEPTWWSPGRPGTQGCALWYQERGDLGFLQDPRHGGSKESHLLCLNPPTWILAWSTHQSSWCFVFHVSLKSLIYTNPWQRGTTIFAIISQLTSIHFVSRYFFLSLQGWCHNNLVYKIVHTGAFIFMG